MIDSTFFALHQHWIRKSARGLVLVPALLLVLAGAARAERVVPPMLSPSAYADTEASTNIAIAPLVGGRSFTVSLSLNATTSNCLEIAVGHDAAPDDGTQLILR